MAENEREINQQEEPEQKREEPKKEKRPKKDAKQDKIKELEAAMAEQKEQMLRLAAEYDNFKKRTEREKESLTDYIRASVLKPLLPAVDNLTRALAADPAGEGYCKGVELSVKSLLEGFAAAGLEEINPEGEAFDPALHEAVMHIEDEALGENVVAQVLQKGYKIGATVIRPAMVQVAN